MPTTAAAPKLAPEREYSFPNTLLPVGLNPRSRLPQAMQKFDYPLYTLFTSNEPRDNPLYHLVGRYLFLQKEFSMQEQRIISLMDKVRGYASEGLCSQDGALWTTADAPFNPEFWSLSDLLALRTLEYDQIRRRSLLATVESSILKYEERYARGRLERLQNHYDDHLPIFSPPPPISESAGITSVEPSLAWL